MSEINKKNVIQLLERIAVYLELKGENPFKISAYTKAAQALERDDRSLSEIEDFTKIKGIGKGTASVIEEYVEYGESGTLKELEEEVPAGLIPLLELPGLGGKKLAKLYDQLGVVDKQTLQAALEEGKVEELDGFGKKSAEKMLQALTDHGSRPERLPIAFMLPLSEKVDEYLASLESVNRYSLAGSMRRVRETIKDLDYIISSDNPEKTRDDLLELPGIKEVIASGETKVSVTVEEKWDVNIDFRIVKDEEFATTLHHFTGSKDHNVLMRQLAKSQGEKISEYGVEDVETGKMQTFDTEEEFYGHFGLSYIPPEVREGTEETELFKETVPLIRIEDIKADLHMHTTWSDGAHSVQEMAERCKAKGYEYIVITDHSKYLRVANGLNETRLRKQREEIRKVNEIMDDFHIFSGVEMDILPDASLDFDDDFLEEMDVVIASIHSSFSQAESEIMKRLNAALENPHVDIIAHPTGRLIGKREGYPVDIPALIQKAKETGTALELNANPNRLDLNAEYLKMAQEEGVMISIDTDAHNFPMLEDMKTGVGTARKGYVRKENVLNTKTREEFQAWLANNSQ
ncbi:DNA polymerase/3'-5' exonuclease PolX [Salimicrobium halophilum]|uniref:DNA-directed DNA polymerase n=1 Tax=Salimicrobium halophilum TaxID=86666 RepID=A0A1G8VGB8_9BACI|nr:DNA polymerase/3'-5' exonuclease PolX [Salimicrobium halophilum]SDJ64937.1 DNA polymerase (family 10) [Salimicrobium halophilum]